MKLEKFIEENDGLYMNIWFEACASIIIIITWVCKLSGNVNDLV